MSGPWRRWEGETLILEVRVQPRASRDEVTGVHGGRLRIRLTAPPVDGAANEGLRRLLAKELGVPGSRVRLLAGGRGREKRVGVQAPARQPRWLR